MNRTALTPLAGDGFRPKTRHFRKTSLCSSSREDFWKKGVKPVIPVTREVAEVSMAHSSVGTSIQDPGGWVGSAGRKPDGLPFDDLDVLDLVGGDEIQRLVLSALRLEGMTLTQKLTVQPSAPDEPVARITDLSARLGGPDSERPGHLLRLSVDGLRMSITAPNAANSKYMVMLFPLKTRRPHEL